MNSKYLDRLTENKDLLILSRNNAQNFVGEVMSFFKAYSSVDYYVRYMEANPIRNVKPWKEAERIKIESADFDLDDVYLRYEKDDIYINLHTRTSTAKYRFIDGVGIYLHDEDDHFARDHLLIVL